MYVDLTAIEAEVIRAFVAENFTEEEIEKIMSKLEKNKHHVPDYKELVGLEKMSDKLDSYWSKQIPCPFLVVRVLSNEYNVYIYKIIEEEVL